MCLQYTLEKACVYKRAPLCNVNSRVYKFNKRGLPWPYRIDFAVFLRSFSSRFCAFVVRATNWKSQRGSIEDFRRNPKAGNKLRGEFVWLKLNERTSQIFLTSEKEEREKISPQVVNKVQISSVIGFSILFLGNPIFILIEA